MAFLRKNNKFLLFTRKVHFGDTDAAGVIHFHNLFRWAHEAWEQSLEAYGLDVVDIFPGCKGNDENPDIALPIRKCQAEFFSPIRTGDNLDVLLEPAKIDSMSFDVLFKFTMQNRLKASALINHIAINTRTRKCCKLPQEIELWLEESSLDGFIRPL